MFEKRNRRIERWNDLQEESRSSREGGPTNGTRRVTDMELFKKMGINVQPAGKA